MSAPTRPGNRLAALLGNLAMWGALFGVVAFGGWALLTLFAGILP